MSAELKQLLETKKGRGKLVSRVTGKEYQVDYDFTITTDVTITSVGALRGKSAAEGTIQSLDETPLPIEDFGLYLDDDEIVHVRNMGLGKWLIKA